MEDVDLARLRVDLDGAEIKGARFVSVATSDLRAILDRLEAAEGELDSWIKQFEDASRLRKVFLDERDALRERLALAEQNDPVQAVLDLCQTFQACGLNAPLEIALDEPTYKRFFPMLAKVERLSPNPDETRMVICHGGCTIGITITATGNRPVL